MIWRISRAVDVFVMDIQLTRAFSSLSRVQLNSSSGASYWKDSILRYENEVYFLQSRMTAVRAASSRRAYISALRLTFNQFKNSRDLPGIGRA